MKQKGFTLIELVMVILVLGIIALITVPTVNSVIKDSKEKAYNSQIKMIEDTAKTYMSKHSLELPKQVNNSSTCISIEKLKKDGLLSNDDIINPKDNDETFDGAVKVLWNGSKYDYKYSESKTC